MQEDLSFEKYYRADILPELNRFEEYRQYELQRYKTWKYIHISAVVIILLIAVSFFSYISKSSNFLAEVFGYFFGSNNITIFYIINIIVILFLILSKKKAIKIKKQFNYIGKSQLFSKIIKLYSGFSYYPEAGIDTQTIYHSNLFNDFDKIKSEDYIQGIYKNLNLQISEINLIKLKAVQEKIGNSYYTNYKECSTYRGLFMIVDINKKFSNSTYILPNKWIKVVNNIPSYLKRAQLEDREFEKEFDVYTDNQVEARYLITPSFMERLISINRNNKISCCFINHKLLMSISLTKEFLPSLELTKPIDYQVIKDIKDQLDIFLKVIDTLKLENNIGL